MYRPLPHFLTIRDSPIDGLGLFAVSFIPKDTDLGMSHVMDLRFPDSFIRMPLGGFFNHSTKPNCTIVDNTDHIVPHLRLKTLRDIEAGEELTAFYTLYIPTEN